MVLISQPSCKRESNYFSYSNRRFNDQKFVLQNLLWLLLRVVSSVHHLQRRWPRASSCPVAGAQPSAPEICGSCPGWGLWMPLSLLQGRWTCVPDAQDTHRTWTWTWPAMQRGLCFQQHLYIGLTSETSTGPCPLLPLGWQRLKVTCVGTHMSLSGLTSKSPSVHLTPLLGPHTPLPCESPMYQLVWLSAGCKKSYALIHLLYRHPTPTHPHRSSTHVILML